MFNIILDAAPAAPGAGPLGPLGSLLPIVIVLVIFYFMIWRPQSKKQKQMNEMRENLKKGDHIMTTSGLKAKVHEVKKEENEVIIETQDGVKLTFDKSAILEIVKK